jgi:ADP-heptose:LPS heptosyltransferase
MKKIELLIKKILLKLLLFFKSGKMREPASFNSDSKILFIRLNRIGDALIVTPLLKLIKDKLQCRIHILADKKNYFVFANNPSVDNIIVFNKGLHGFLEILKLIRANNYDAIVDLHDDISNTVTFLLAFSSAKNIFGLKKANHKVYTKTIDRLESSQTHVVDRNLELAKLFNIEPVKEKINIQYHPKEEAVKKIKTVLDKINPGKKFLVGINISAGDEARFWGIERFRELINFLNNYNLIYILLTTVEDKDSGLKIVSDPEKIFYTISFDEFAAMISELNLLFTPDTSTVHLGSAFKIPVFGLYVKYRTKDMIWSPYGSDFDYILTTEPTLDNLSYEQVIKKFQPFLEKHLL